MFGARWAVIRLLIVPLAALVAMLATGGEPALSAATFTVNSTADPGDGVCDVAECTLREAIEAANVTDGKDTVAFGIPGAGPHTIQPTLDLPLIFEPIVIDATSQPGYSGTPLLALDGSLGGAGFGFIIFNGNSEIRGFAIGNFEVGIVISGEGGNVIQANHIGTDPAGLSRERNSTGVGILGSDGNIIGGPDPGDGNLISGNIQAGIELTVSDGNQIVGNLIGTDITGWTALANGNGIFMGESSDNVVGGAIGEGGNTISGNEFAGVWLGNAHGNVIEGNRIGTNAEGWFDVPNVFGVLIEGGSSGNRIGGPSETQKNLISGNLEAGVHLFSETANNRVIGNLIGTDIDGTYAIGNRIGVALLIAADNAIGGLAPGEGNVISGNQIGVEISDETSTGNTIQGNFIGTSRYGDSSIPNEHHGILLFNAGDNMVGGVEPGARNLIVGSRENVTIEGFGQATGNVVQGNYIGTDLTGTVALGDSQIGVSISDASQTLVGGPLPGHRNVIAGNETEVAIFGSDNLVQGNYIGLDASGSEVLRGRIGVEILFGQGNLIGGDSPGLGNTIGDSVGVEILGASSNVIQGNFIGTDATGNGFPRQGGDRFTGISLRESRDNTIGGTTAGAENVIASYVFGVDISSGSVGNSIEGNHIGIGADGATPLDVFIGVMSASSGNSIGGLAPGAGNTIAHNGFGVVLRGGDQTPILSNEIFGHTRLGIDLGDDDVTPNDVGDGDDGANGLQNFPDLNTARTNGAETVVRGTLDSLPGQVYILQFFSNLACSRSGFGEGERLLGTVQVSTSADGIADFAIVLPATALPETIPEGHFVTATATDPAGNTSEFSQCIEVEMSNCHDLNGDGKVSGRDLAVVARALFSQPGHKRWNPDADLNRDEVVNVWDLKEILLSLHDPECDVK